MKTRTETITREELESVLDYDPGNGSLRWKFRDRSMFGKDSEFKRWNGRYAGVVINGINKGYANFKYKGQMYKAHRVIWFLHYGEWPREIDHINHQRADNVIGNLRDIDPNENQRNASQRKDNTTGVTGVNRHKKNDCWTASIFSGRVIYLGSFKDKNEAIKARKTAEKKYGFHENHGAYNAK